MSDINRSGVHHLPSFFPEPQSLSSKKDRDKRNLRYVPPAPRPHQIRSAPTQTRLIHSRNNDFFDLDNSFHLLTASSGNGNSQTFFRQFFEIQERLGFGSFGDVFRVKSRLDGKEFAIKKSRKTYSGEGDRSRQLREVQRVVNIPTNVHLVELERAWEEEGHLYLQMELCLKSLNQDIEESQNNKDYSETETWNVLIDMLYALQHLHKNRLVHMDVKPDNIFLTMDMPPVYKLGDFGIVVSLEEKQDLTEFCDGDSRYLAPEVIQGFVSTKADVFSLGLTILEVACHVDLPKGGELWHQLRSGGEFPDPCDKWVPESLRRVLKLMLEPDVTKRPEIEDILKLPEVKRRCWRRHWTLSSATLKRKFGALTRFWNAFLCFLTSLIFFSTKKRNRDGSGSNNTDFRATPEPYPVDRNMPDLLLNDTSFSDIDDDIPQASRNTTPIFASTPISHSKTVSGGRLRSGRGSRQGTDGDLKPTGSPTSRNLLKEFEAVSE